MSGTAGASVELVIQARSRQLTDGLAVRRLLPFSRRRMVGPFIYFDHMGPIALPPGQGLDVLPHPHINLATITYLFEGALLHRDSLGSEQLIRPGEVNWMTAGSGIVHSERTPPEMRRTAQRTHGLQLWVALPKAHEETAPSFHHYRNDDIPVVEGPGFRLRVVAGTAFGATSPVHALSSLFYVEARLEEGALLNLPDNHAERAAYVVEGTIVCDAVEHGAGAMLVFRSGAACGIHAAQTARVMLLGGAPLDGERHIFWNFVSSSKERIEKAKLDWKERRFPAIPGDSIEFIPLPG